MSESDFDNLSWADVRDLFREWREENVRQSKRVVDLWVNVLQKKEHKLGDEGYLVLEQVCIAAADVNRIDIVDHCIYQLDKQFPGSFRVRKLKILKLEITERYDEALKQLDELCKLDDTNAAPKKRKIAILKARGQTSEAIKELTEYLKK